MFTLSMLFHVFDRHTWSPVCTFLPHLTHMGAQGHEDCYHPILKGTVIAQ